MSGLLWLQYLSLGQYELHFPTASVYLGALVPCTFRLDQYRREAYKMMKSTKSCPNSS